MHAMMYRCMWRKCIW